MKDTYIRFRCTEDEKALIEHMAKAMGVSVTDYILDLARRDRDCYEPHEFEVVIHRKDKEALRKRLGTYLLMIDGRASKRTTYDELNKLAREVNDSVKGEGTYSIESDGRKVLTNPMTDYMWLEDKGDD